VKCHAYLGCGELALLLADLNGIALQLRQIDFLRDYFEGEVLANDRLDLLNSMSEIVQKCIMQASSFFLLPVTNVMAASGQTNEMNMASTRTNTWCS
jgi:hypothetical protein